MTPTPPEPAPDTDAGTGAAGRHSGRRAAARPARRRVGPAAVLAVLLPLATLGGALTLAPDAAEPAPAAAPEQVALTEQTLVCPPAAGGSAAVVVGRIPDAGAGAVTVGRRSAEPAPGGTTDPVDVRGGPVVVQGTGEAAPGLLAGRFAEETTAATACEPPAAEQWLTGLGAGPERSSVLELVNPETGPAVVDVTLHGRDGVLDVPDVEGVTVPAGERTTLDLAEVVPTGEDLAARVQVVRGRLGVTALDRITPLAGSETGDWVPAQPEPAATSLLPGLVGGPGERTLTVANPGEADTQVEVQVVTPTGAITPVGVRELQVPAGGVASVELGSELAAQVDEGAGGLLLRSAAPVTATLRSVVRDDLALTAAVPAAATGAALVPDGDARVVLTAPPDADPAVAEIVARDAAGETLGTERVELEPGTVAEVDLPDAATAVGVEAGSPVSGSVVVRRGDGTVVLPLRTPVTDALVPRVRPGTP